MGGPIIRAHSTNNRLRHLAATGVAAAAVVLLVAAANPAAAQEGRRYQVRRGETLSGIAHEHGVSVSAIAGANGLGDPDLVVAGSWLQIPAGSGGGAAPARQHRVRSGETLSGIADHYGLATSTLAQANGIDDPDVVVIGTVLTVPAVGSGGGSTSGSSLPRRLRTNSYRMSLMPTFDIWAARYGVPADLLKATTWLESGWQNDVVSSTGAVGIGQLMPVTVDTLNDLMGTNLSPWRTSDNIRLSARNLRFLLDLTGGNTAKALAGYYQGLGSVARDGLYPSTLAYINGVLALRSRFG